MATQKDVRRIALAMPEAVEAQDNFAFSVADRKGKQRGFLWVWQERTHPKKARVPNPGVIAVRVSGDEEKQILLSIDEAKFFTEPHYNGFPAVLVRLANVEAWELEEVIVNAWRCMAPKALVQQYNPTKSTDPGTPRLDP